MRTIKKPCNYPVLDAWIKKHGLTYREFARKSDISHATVLKILYETGNVTKITIDNILAFTGLSYEECFNEYGVEKND